jgi:2,6-dihydroxypseudooxynicotine hydrolase
MFEAELRGFLDGGRLAADGAPFGILREVAAGLERRQPWADVWEAVSARFEAEADSAAARGAALSAAGWLWQASFAAHASQLHAYDNLSRRGAAETRRRQLYWRAVPGLSRPARPVTLRCGGAETTGYVRLPAGQAQPAPCLILLGGLDSTKEESLLFEDLCLARGLATFVFDGPGQGETRSRVPLGEPFEPWIAQALDRLTGAAPELDADRIGILGRSLGGHFALRAAAAVPGLRCCVAWSPLGTCVNWDGYPEAIRWGFRYAAGTEDMTRARAVVEAALDLDDALPRIAIPAYVTHGGRDRIVPLEEQAAMRRLSSPSVLHQTFAEGSHCCHNLAHLVRPMMADWAAARLGALSGRALDRSAN